MEMFDRFQEASELAGRGKHREAAARYEAALDQLEAMTPRQRPDDEPAFRRALAFNLAQEHNHLGNYERCLELLRMGLECGPTEFGKAIAHAAEGEALAQLGRVEEARAAFEAASGHHPVVGRLNSADSMTRLDSDVFLIVAEREVKTVLLSYSEGLTPELRDECRTILERLERRGSIGATDLRAHFGL